MFPAHSSSLGPWIDSIILESSNKLFLAKIIPIQGCISVVLARDDTKIWESNCVGGSPEVSISNGRLELKDKNTGKTWCPDPKTNGVRP